MEHEICKGCKWNKYPICDGTKNPDGSYMEIEELCAGFICGQKNRDNINDLYFREKSKLELLQEELEDLKTRLDIVENK